MNIINAIYNLVSNPVTELVEHYNGRNRVNNSGYALEEYIKDLFADSFGMTEIKRIEKHNKVFSYLGNDSNPPDAMLKNGDAIEVKKIESNNSALALNSSYPKHTLLADSTMLSAACKNAEEWTEKDIIYSVGVVKGNELKSLCFVYGLDYCASDECYSRIKKTIKNGVENIAGVEFAETNELGRINRIDPLGITYLRVRGMWGIDNPWNVFSYVYERNMRKSFNFMCIINESKWKKFNNVSILEDIVDNNFCIKDIKIKNPDNPAKLVNAKLITYTVD